MSLVFNTHFYFSPTPRFQWGYSTLKLVEIGSKISSTQGGGPALVRGTEGPSERCCWREKWSGGGLLKFSCPVRTHHASFETWSVKREEFRSALLQRIAKTLMIHTPNLSKKSAADIALVVLLNVKAVATHHAFFDSESSAPDEVRDMTRLYLQSRLRSSSSAKKGISS